MPYEIRKSKGGYKVFHKGTSKSYSSKPQLKGKANAQLRALYANTKDEAGHQK
jgi:hypothetical protein